MIIVRNLRLGHTMLHFKDSSDRLGLSSMKLNDCRKGKHKTSRDFTLKKKRGSGFRFGMWFQLVVLFLKISAAAPGTPKKAFNHLFDEHRNGTEDCQVKMRHSSLWQRALVYIVYNFFVLFTINNCLCRNSQQSEIRPGSIKAAAEKTKEKEKKKIQFPLELCQLPVWKQLQDHQPVRLSHSWIVARFDETQKKNRSSMFLKAAIYTHGLNFKRHNGTLLFWCFVFHIAIFPHQHYLLESLVNAEGRSFSDDRWPAVWKFEQL